eukprot:m.798191 g.798191  ORF g.798191 m.798191 type:complete len:227 (+) comp23349_c0_seq34:310-990(+)
MAKDSMKKKVIVKTDNEGSTFDFWAVLYRVILYFSTFVSSLAMVSALAAAQREQSGSSCSNFPSGYLPCPLEIDFDRRCSTDVGAGSCDWVFIIGSVSTVVAMLYTVYTYYCLVRTRTSPSQWIVLEFIASFILAGCVLSAASIITHKIRGMCDTVTSVCFSRVCSFFLDQSSRVSVLLITFFLGQVRVHHTRTTVHRSDFFHVLHIRKWVNGRREYLSYQSTKLL